MTRIAGQAIGVMGGPLSEGCLLNFDGALAYQSTRRGVAQAYTQLFRNGMIEAVDSTFMVETNEGKWFDHEYEAEVVKTTHMYMDLLESLEVYPPYMVGLSLLGVKDLAMPVVRGQSPGFPIRETALLLPDIEIEVWPADLYAAFRPIFDMVWQAMGMDRSANYDDEGNWAPRR